MVLNAATLHIQQQPVVRPFTALDHAQCQRIVVANWGADHCVVQRFEEAAASYLMSRDPKKNIVVLEVDGEIVAFTGYGESMMSSHLADIWLFNVDPAHHGHGHGSDLLKEVLKNMHAGGLCGVILATTHAEGFYLPYGFKTIYTFQNREGEWKHVMMLVFEDNVHTGPWLV